METFNEMSRKLTYLNSATIKCKCSHSVLISPKQKRAICSWCGRYVYKDSKEEFKQNLLTKLKKIEQG